VVFDVIVDDEVEFFVSEAIVLSKDAIMKFLPTEINRDLKSNFWRYFWRVGDGVIACGRNI
jgi:hypothetical protein